MTDATFKRMTQPAADFLPLLSYAFQPSPPLAKIDWLRQATEETQSNISIGAYAGDTVRACGSAAWMQHNVRGALYEMGGVWGVATHPAARRKGYARGVMTALFEAMHEAGYPLTTLFAFKESFYTRLGYTVFPVPKLVKFRPDGLAPLLKRDDQDEVEMVLHEDAYDRLRHYLLNKPMHRQHGFSVFMDEPFARLRIRNPHWVAFVRRNGEDVGLIVYRIVHEGSDEIMKVRYFFYDDARAKYTLLRWFALHVDHMRWIHAYMPPDVRIETWHPDLFVEIDSQDPGLGRVLDVQRIGGMATGPGAFTARITDDYCPWNASVFRFDGEDGTLKVEEASTPDFTLSIQGLSALVYGSHDPADFAYRGWSDANADGLAVMQRMFPMAAPFLSEEF